jgi:Acetyltransferase (GNAT) domain
MNRAGSRRVIPHGVGSRFGSDLAGGDIVLALMAGAGSCELVRLEIDDPRWFEFVATRPEATPLQEPAWASFIAQCYGFNAFVLALKEGERLTAGIPVIETRKPLGRRRWLSLPFTDECGPLGDEDGKSELTAEVDVVRRGERVSSHEIRAAIPDAAQRLRGVSHRLILHDDLDAIVRNYRSSIRQGIRVASREGVVVRRAESSRDLTHTFYAMHVATRRRLGVPVQRRRYFALLWERLIAPGKGFVLLAERARVPLAGAVFLHSNRFVIYKYGASDAAHWRLRANTTLFHEAISRSVDSGRRIFDWGRTDLEDEGLRRFKSSWGSIESELFYSTLGVQRAEDRRGGHAAELARGVIRRSPKAVSRLAGALLYRYAA